ncbi:Zinc finger C2H2-type, partial [Trinorchestia longiramus]
IEGRYAGSRTPKYISPEEMARRPFKCQFCASRFKSKSNQRQHERLHTGEKPYRCEICDSAFVQLASLLHHKAKNH